MSHRGRQAARVEVTREKILREVDIGCAAALSFPRAQPGHPRPRNGSRGQVEILAEALRGRDIDGVYFVASGAAVGGNNSVPS